MNLDSCLGRNDNVVNAVVKSATYQTTSLHLPQLASVKMLFDQEQLHRASVASIILKNQMNERSIHQRLSSLLCFPKGTKVHKH